MTGRSDNLTCLVADIGGTNTRVALADGTDLNADSITRYANSEHTSLNQVLDRFIKEHGNPECSAACVAVAGPVRDGVGALTNLDWAIDRPTLSQATGADDVAILNDLQAQGHALGYLTDHNIQTVIAGAAAAPSASKMVIGVGTGFNAAAVFDGDSGRLVPPSESGHASLPIRSQQDMDLCGFIDDDDDFPAVEDVLSGPGLERVYQWHRHVSGDPGKKKAADIMASMASGDDAIATQTVQTFIRILGNVVGDQALVQLPFGGVFLVGGVARAVAPYLEQLDFRGAFRAKGRFAAFMDDFSVSVINDDWAALVGCAHHIQAIRGNLELTANR